ncbi:MAG TPA: YbaK/EbsC family protein [Jatrophihabitans sp.]|nr:YbaK/EbsC family protein [Jatrophihabitans sp.]
MADLHPTCVLINSILQAAGLPGRVRILDRPAPTAVTAAEQLGVEVGAIVNSLIFSTAERAPLLVLTSGAHRVDTARVAALVGTATLSRATADFVRETTGQPIGGVAPIGHPAPIRTLLDTALAEFPEIWAAGGIPHAVFPISYPDLAALTSAQPVAVA